MQQPQMPNFDLDKTTKLKGFDGGDLFEQKIILRKVSKFLTGGSEDAILPIPVFVCNDSGKILLNTLPPELRSEYKDEGFEA